MLSRFKDSHLRKIENSVKHIFYIIFYIILINFQAMEFVILI